MTIYHAIRQHQVLQRRVQREEQKQARELERRLKEMAKLGELERAKLEVEAFENQIALLRSIHKECGEVWNWDIIAFSLPTAPPRKFSEHETNTQLRLAMLKAKQHQITEEEIQRALEQARAQDEHEFLRAGQDHIKQTAERARLKGLACRVLNGDPKGYAEALAEFSPLAELSALGSSLHFSIHSPSVVECEINVNGIKSIPSETKALTTTGKLSVKAMSRTRFHELYQDHICSSMLRVAREVFVLLPVNIVLVTAMANVSGARTGQNQNAPVLSVEFIRQGFEALEFENLDPSDAIEEFRHNGDFKASRKTEAFMPIHPLQPCFDIPGPPVESGDSSVLLDHAMRLRAEMRKQIPGLNQEESSLQTDIQS
jgi:hypothetical protein